MIKRSLALVVFPVALVLAGLVGWVAGMEYYAGQAKKADEPVLGLAPHYRDLTNQLGQTVSSGQFNGKVQVVTFLFPYCTTYCPLIAAHLVGLENLLKDAGLQNQVEIVAFNVDPAGTGPAQMRAFLKEYHWDPSDPHWQYLTGKPKAIRRIVTGGYHVSYQKVVDGQDDSPQGPELTPQPDVVNPLATKAHVNYDISHNDGLVLVDPQGRIRKIYAQADVVSNRTLLKAIKQLLTTGAGG